jgi:two-component system response regulator FlrC
VRELDNLLQRALILVNGPVIEQEHIQFELLNDSLIAVPERNAAAKASLADSLDQVEKERILEALQDGNVNRREAAEKLGISPRTLRHKLARLREAGVDVPAA